VVVNEAFVGIGGIKIRRLILTFVHRRVAGMRRRFMVRLDAVIFSAPAASVAPGC
jgi:hypothetical protein